MSGVWRSKACREIAVRVLSAILLPLAPPATEAVGQTAPPSTAPTSKICSVIEASAHGHALPPEFVARLLWKESRFDPRAVSPKGALGIAQFMPETARSRGLADPFDPEKAIPASAAYLADLRRKFGNLGLAAAAYNGGEGRVDDWIAGNGELPRETLDYVESITGRPAAWFRGKGSRLERRALRAGMSFDEACRTMPSYGRSVLFPVAVPKVWTVQVAGHRRRTTAVAQFARLTRRLPQTITSAGSPLLRERTASSAGPFWSVEIPVASRRRAIDLCSELRRNGAACVIWNDQ